MAESPPSRRYGFHLARSALVLWASPLPAIGANPDQPGDPERYLEVVRTFADNVLERGRDVYGEKPTPLFADGLNVDTGEPVVWRFDGEEWIISNFASQQNLMRTLVGLTNLSGDDRYRGAAEAAARHMFDYQSSECGLLYWGGHQIVDLRTQENIGHFDADCHELKVNLPYYSFLWEVDPEATRRMLEAIWNAHILDWEVLDMNRHGEFGLETGRLWDHDFDRPEPFFEGRGLTFINTGTDLIHAGGMLHALGGDEGALTWTRRLAEQYVRARHPETGLGVYQYSRPERREEPPQEGPLDGRLTWSTYGDRAENQFGREFGDVAREGWVLWGGRARTIYVSNALVQLELAERLGDDGEELLEWTVEGMKAYFRHAYDPESNHFRPLWADGTDLTGEKISRTGYYGENGDEFQALPADTRFLFSYARAYRLSRDASLWNALRSMGNGIGLGDFGAEPGSGVEPDLDTTVFGTDAVFALLEIARTVDDSEPYLLLARRVADNMIERRFHDGFFLGSRARINANFNAVEPLALLALAAVLRETPELVPVYSGGRGYIHGRYDGYGRTYCSRAIWSVTREN